ncbi:MAG: integrase arm-type DNA-binding domain-containing protein [Candidatus Accumulibacter sp.]|jgi:integrase|nr:integrase arm-type DNA-binding domain-containing protein [Accumulibacter sp.]
MPLADTTIRAAKPADKPVRLFDGGGLYVEISPSGSKLWRLKYRIEGKEKRLSFGAYPSVSLKEARERRDEARKLLAAGTDPGAVKKAQKMAARAEQDRGLETFEKAAWSWFNAWKLDKVPSNVEKIRGRLIKDVLPWLGGMPVADVKPHDIFKTCGRIQSRGAKETAHRVLGDLDAIFKYVITEDAKNQDITNGLKPPRFTLNPCSNLRGWGVQLLETTPPKKHFAHFEDERTGGVSLVKLGEYLRAMDGFAGSYVVHAALRLVPMLFCRPGEQRNARWSEFDLSAGEWSFTISKAKPSEEPRRLTIPLPRQAVEILMELHSLTRDCEFVFMGHRDKTRPMSDAAVNAAIRRLGFDTRCEICGHGFRHVASSLLNEQGYPADVIEVALGHKTRGIRGVYDHAQYLEQRKK